MMDRVETTAANTLGIEGETDPSFGNVLRKAKQWPDKRWRGKHWPKGEYVTYYSHRELFVLHTETDNTTHDFWLMLKGVDRQGSEIETAMPTTEEFEEGERAGQ